MSPTTYFRDKHVLITGGSSGIGLALARHVLALGARVTLVARRASRLDEAKAALGDERVVTRSVDVTDPVALSAAIDELSADGLDVLVNSAGVTLPGRFVDLPAEEFRAQMDINYFGVVNACRAVVPRFVAQKSGHIVNVGSLGGIIGIFGYSAYAPTKFAVAGFSQALRAELWPHGVKVSVAHPPDTDTPMLAMETPHRPAETRAIAGTAAVKSADAVASAILEGAAAGDFDIYCDLGSRAMAVAQGVFPSIVRWVCDGAQRKALG